jgi:putative restriction endonuclease
MSETLRGIERAFGSLRTWKRGDERALHKPLLVLYALGRVQCRQHRLVPFASAERPLEALLKEFGPTRKSYHPEYPFWRLQADGIWEIPDRAQLQSRQSNTDPPITQLRLASGGFLAEIDDALRADAQLLRRTAQQLLDAHFPESLHPSILASCNLDLTSDPTVTSGRVARDPNFRIEVLRAYGHRCALCGYHASIDGAVVALEAAHVMWHCYSGPNTVENGLSLCPLHHRVFDLGLVTIRDQRVLVSARVTEGGSSELHLGRLHGNLLHGPVSGYPSVSKSYSLWHQDRVFKAPSRAES